jgi:polysaccharide biosynthesis transport protein
MRDELDDKPQEPIDWEYYRGLVRRHALHFLIVFFAGWLVVWVASWFMPSIYRSGTLILVEEPTVPQEFVVPNVAGDLQTRLQSITQQILSRTRLLRIIDKLSLYPAYREHSSPDDLVERMRKDIQIDLNRSGDNRELTSFNINYSARDPETARAVTSELCNLFINENLELRQQQSKGTTDFLENQLQAARRNLAEQEQKVKDFKDKHLGELPGQLQTNLQVLAGLQSQLQNEQDGLTRARQQDAYLESLLNQYRTVQRPTKGADGPVSLPAIDQELEKLRSELRDLRGHYTEKHPDMRKVKNQIAEAERLKSQLQQGTSTTAQPQGQPSSAADLDERSPIFQLENQLKANNYEIGNHQTTIKELQGRIGQYQARLNQEPVLEQQLADITRGYEQSKADYDSLLKKKNESELATNLEFQQKGEHFRVLDPPNLPQKPFSPQRIKLFAIGIAIGVIVGAGFSVVREYMSDRIFSERELKKLLPYDVIAELPPVQTVEHQVHERRIKTLRWMTTGIVISTLVVAFGYTYLRG